MTHEQLAAMAKHFFYVFPKLASNAKIPKHIKFISDEVQKAIEKKSDKNRMIIINVPCRHGKSMLISCHLPAWYLGTYPDRRIILASYASDLSDKHSDYAKDIFAKWGPALWDVKPSKTIFNRSAWDTEQRGGCISAGVGSGITGFGSDCLFFNSLIDTDVGKKEICKLKIGDKVLSYNNGKLSYNKILAIKTSLTKEIYEITIDGDTIKSTGKHRFFVVGKGYVEARDLREGDKTISLKQSMYTMWGEEGWSWVTLSKLLSGIKKIRSRINLRKLWKEIQKKVPRNKEGSRTWIQLYILFNEMLARTLSSKIWKDVHSLWKTYGWCKYKILLAKMQKCCKNEKKYSKNMPRVSKNIFYKDKIRNILFKKMCCDRQRHENIERKACKLQNRIILPNGIQKNKKRHTDKIWKLLPNLWKFRKNIGSSCGLEQVQQFGHKLSSIMQKLSHKTAQIEEKQISKIKRFQTDEQLMYDIQVEETNNFFANNTLVHNCLIIDDYCKGHEDAESKTQREKLWNWWQSVASSRLHPNSVVIILATRWHSDDLSGRLIQQYNEEGDDFPFDFKHINLPAIAEEDDPLGRKPGEALWPERFSAKMLMNVKKTAGPFVWASLWQGNPRARGGNLFKSMYFRYWTLDWITNSHVCHLPDQEPMIIPSKDLRRIVIVDPALEIKTRNDPSGMLAWGYSKKYKVWLLLDALKGKIKHEILHDTILNFAFRNKCNEIFVENEKIGKILIKQSSGRDKMNGVSIPFKEVKTKNKDKFSRCIPMASYTENGRVFFKKDAPWLEEYESDLTVFPDSDDDCWADCTGHASILEKSISVAEALARAMKLK